MLKLFFLIYFYSFAKSVSSLNISINMTNNASNNTDNSSIPCDSNANYTNCNNGTCNNLTQACDCNKGYMNTENNGLQFPCAYKQRKQLDTFLLEMMLGFGAGQFYSLRYLHGALKFIAYLLGIISICLFPYTLSKSYEMFTSKIVAFTIAFSYCFLAVGFAVWYIYDLIMIKNNRYIDGNGFPLLSWS